VKLDGSAGFGVVKVTTTGAVVPGVKAGMLTTALVGAPTTVSACKPVPALTWSTVTEPGPLITPKEAIPPGNKSPSVTVVLGVQVCGIGVPIGDGVGLGVGVVVGVGVGVGLCADVCPLNTLIIAKSAKRLS